MFLDVRKLNLYDLNFFDNSAFSRVKELGDILTILIFLIFLSLNFQTLASFLIIQILLPMKIITIFLLFLFK